MEWAFKRDATELAEEAVGRKLSPGEVSSYWTGRAADYARTHVFDWVRLMARKCFLVWNTGEIGDTEDQYTYADWSRLLAALTMTLPFGLILVLAVQHLENLRRLEAHLGERANAARRSARSRGRPLLRHAAG